eukprot:NODE_2172_length_972_cov_84.975081_g1785_i0.p1 GENE.NODE_2172_length_972_cov_84.975081_g1785_i0~~NODE_2172_length_972_cov_84.975081_g1785_i0.p1  ORF type:complete len:220 (+),score=12.04 NODE_2172_length_972_cov_84.975081_g1785_i0:47-661(+)
MGNIHTRISEYDMKQYRNSSEKRLKDKDIKKYHKFWYKLFPNGNADKKGFKKFANIALPNAPKDANVDHLFRAMDEDQNGEISFNEFLIFQSVTAPTRGKADNYRLIDLVFNMYDEDQDGYVTKKEMFHGLKNIFKANGYDVSKKAVLEVVEKRVEFLVSFDENGDCKLTKDEIKRAYDKDRAFLTNLISNELKTESRDRHFIK